MEKILWSDLEISTVHGTGFGLALPSATGKLKGPPLQVQVIALTEVVRPDKPRRFKFKLFDGEKVMDAYANVTPLSIDLDFDSIKLGSKVSKDSTPYPK